ncbi:hypothetical protein [Rhodococcus globerulus]|uniref:Uncharacterized protein n=1 Tax=Rhodococcus globerulus TaxID=33008 RepID=A0ABU4BPK4_RHOGO|nr:hypothetical protein [Rhodococcus globerulus]MDV6266131.1 hypothetical protein [Rhodococcus globerulus]
MGVRLSVVDEMFLWTHRGLGLPIVMQGVWRTDSIVDPSELEQLCVRVASGPLGRRVRRPRIPGARPEFIADPRHYPLSFRSEPVAADSVIEWADAAALLSVDPERGPGWRIAATYDSDGGTVVSVACSHVLADARGLIGALSDAMQRKPSPPIDRTGHSDLTDARSTVGRVLRGTTRAVGGLIVSPARRAELRGFTTPAAATRRFQRHSVTSAVLEIDRDQWDDVATSSGGTANSLFLACVGELARAENKTASVTLSVPMNVRTTDQGDNSVDNSVAMVAIPLTPSTTLAQIRTLCRDAFEAPPMSSPAGFPAELLQVVPDRVAHRLADGPGQRDALCSNIGTVDIDQFEGHRTTGLALRAVHPGASAAQLDDTSTRVSGYLSRNHATYTLSLVSFVSADNQALRTLACNTLEKFGIFAHPW